MQARAARIAERALALALLGLAVGMLGCAEVAPWERGRFAKPHMALAPAATALREHTYMSREAAAGAKIGSGGGCGCY